MVAESSTARTFLAMSLPRSFCLGIRLGLRNLRFRIARCGRLHEELLQPPALQRCQKSVGCLADIEQASLAAHAAENLNDASVQVFQFPSLEPNVLPGSDGRLHGVPE